MEISITLNANEVQEIIQDYLNNQGINAEVTSTKCDYSGVCCKATLNPQPTAAPRQCVEPASYNLPPIEPLGAAMADGNITTLESNALFLGSDGRRLTEDEIRKLHE